MEIHFGVNALRELKIHFGGNSFCEHGQGFSRGQSGQLMCCLQIGGEWAAKEKNSISTLSWIYFQLGIAPKGSDHNDYKLKAEFQAGNAQVLIVMKTKSWVNASAAGL